MGECVHDEQKTKKWHQQHPLTSIATTTVALCSGDSVVVVVMAIRASVVCLCRQSACVVVCMNTYTYVFV